MFKITPMPSPKGTNHERRYLIWTGGRPTPRGVAYDSAEPVDRKFELIQRMLKLLQGKLDPDKLEELVHSVHGALDDDEWDLIQAEQEAAHGNTDFSIPEPFRKGKHLSDKARDWMRKRGFSSDDVEELASVMEGAGRGDRRAARAKDGPPPFKSMPRPSGEQAMDARALRRFEEWYPSVTRIKVL